MRTRTADGHTLQLPDARLGTILPQLHSSGLDGLVRQNYDGDLSRAIARSVGQLANRAQRVGALRSRQTGSRYPVFSSALGGRSFQIVTRPGGAGAGTIVGIRPQASAATGSAEYMAAAPNQPALGPRRALSTAVGDATLNVPGVYQIYKDGRLIYVGQSQNIRVRLQQHLLCLTHMAIPPAGYDVAAGPMPSSVEQTRRAEERRRIDQNRARQGNSLTNQREFEMMMGDEGEAIFGLPSWSQVRDWARSPTGAGRFVGDLWRRFSSSAPSLRAGALPPAPPPPPVQPPPSSRPSPPPSSQPRPSQPPPSSGSGPRTLRSRRDGERELESMLGEALYEWEGMASQPRGRVSAEQRRRMSRQQQQPTPRRGRSGIRGQGPPTVRTGPPDPGTLRQGLQSAANSISQAAGTMGSSPTTTVRALELAQGSLFLALAHPPYSNSATLRNANSRLSTFISRWSTLTATEASSELHAIASLVRQATTTN